MEAYAFAKETKTVKGTWKIRCFFKDEEKAYRRTIYEKGIVVKLINIPNTLKKYIVL